MIIISALFLPVTLLPGGGGRGGVVLLTVLRCGDSGHDPPLAPNVNLDNESLQSGVQVGQSLPIKLQQRVHEVAATSARSCKQRIN